jgi:GntR family histidine utilization transcriptional repressor
MTPSAAPTQPAYLKLKRHVLARIAEGAWKVGERVPSEHELGREFRLSRMTVHRALRELAASGAITRRQGLGSFVAGPKVESTLVTVQGIREEIRARGQAHRAEVLTLRRVRADAALATAFGLPERAWLFHSRLLHWADERPLQLEDRHVAPAAAPDYLRQDFASETTPHHYLSRVAPLERAEHSIEADLPGAQVARWLRLGAHEPVLLLQRRTWSRGQVVSVARLTHPARHYRLSGTFTFDPLR